MKDIEINAIMELNSTEIKNINGGASEVTEAIWFGIGWFAAFCADVYSTQGAIGIERMA